MSGFQPAATHFSPRTAAPRRVLIVSWLFPPTHAIGALRVSKFARYLRDFGWETKVVTAAPDLLPFPEALPVEIPELDIVRVRYRDPITALERRWGTRRVVSTANDAGDPSAVGVARQSTREPLPRRVARAVLRRVPIVTQVRLPDRSTFWYVPALRAARTLCAQWPPDAIFSSHGPPGAHIVASRLHRELRVPWIADYRDLWSGHYGFRYPAPFELADRLIEKAVVRPATVLTTVSDQLAAYLEALHDKRVLTLFNGYDESDYTGPVEPTQDFVIVFTGLAQAPHRDPSVLFDAVARMRRNSNGRSRLPIMRFVGPTPAAYLQGLARHYAVEDLVRIDGNVPLRESIRLQRSSTVLLAINWSTNRASGPGGILSGKLMEYLGAGRPILVVGPHDPGVSEVLARTGAGVWSNDPAELESTLRQWMKTHEETGCLQLACNAAELAMFSRRSQAGRLATLLDEITGRGRPAAATGQGV